jgi:hypothetical protein
MIVFDLQCAGAGHVFEAWFNSSDAYLDQQKRGLIACPFCNDTHVTKAIMAPNIAPKGNQIAPRSSSSPPAATLMSSPSDGDPATEMKRLLTKIAQLQAETIKDSTWVGKDFDRQARAMDAGEMDQNVIHGQATPDQARELMEDGIGVMPLLIPIIPPKERN